MEDTFEYVYPASVRVWSASSPLLCLVACGPAELFVPTPPLDFASAAVLSVIETNSRHHALTAEPTSIPIDADSATLLAAEWRCPTVEALGFTPSGTFLAAPPGGRVANPVRVWSSSYPDSPSSWSALPELPTDPRLGLAVNPKTPCASFSSEIRRDLNFGTTTPRFAIALRDQVLLSVSDRLLLFDAERLLLDLQVDGEVPREAALFDRSGQLWLYGADGQLWHGPLETLETMTVSYVREPANPFFVPCTRQSFSIAMDLDDESASEIVVVGSSGAIARYDAAVQTWIQLRPSESQADGSCAAGDVSVARTHDRWTAALSGLTSLAIIEGEVVRSVPVRYEDTLAREPQRVLAAPAWLARGRSVAVFTTRTTELFEIDLDSEVIRRISRSGFGANVSNTKALVESPSGELFWGGTDGMFQIQPNFGPCETPPLDTTSVAEIVLVNRGLVLLTRSNGAATSQVYELRREDRGCKPSVP